MGRKCWTYNGTVNGSRQKLGDDEKWISLKWQFPSNPFVIEDGVNGIGHQSFSGLDLKSDEKSSWTAHS